MTRVIIAGSRKFCNYPKMLEALRLYIGYKYIDDLEIISGHAPGADALGEKFARDCGYKLKIFPAEWDKYDRAAGPIRNEQMAKYASEADKGILVAFPIGESIGTRNMITLAKRYGLEVHVIK